MRGGKSVWATVGPGPFCSHPITGDPTPHRMSRSLRRRNSQCAMFSTARHGANIALYSQSTQLLHVMVPSGTRYCHGSPVFPHFLFLGSFSHSLIHSLTHSFIHYCIPGVWFLQLVAKLVNLSFITDNIRTIIPKTKFMTLFLFFEPGSHEAEVGLKLDQ